MKAKATLVAWNAIGHYKSLFVLLLLFGSITAATPIDAIKGLVSTICTTLTGILPILAFTLFVLAGVAYGIGNFFGADTRAKAAGWGMSALTGAIIMLIIYIMGPIIISALYGTATCTSATANTT